jgi:protein-S-isoprenylcysteine O-methyltransferase Ste14
VLLTIDAARSIDLLDLAGIRQTTGRQTGAGIQARGAYRFVRHPIYLGWALLTFGAPVMTATRFSFACISTLYLIVAIPFEERSLVEAFGDEYREYRRRVRWRMLPGVY